MSGIDREHARRRLAEAFVKEASRNRFHPPAHCDDLKDDDREAYLQRSIRQLAETISKDGEVQTPDARP